jgi:hypothetical protein
MAKKKPLIVMVSSTVYGIEELTDRKSNRMRTIMPHVLGITGLQPGSA